MDDGELDQLALDATYEESEVIMTPVQSPRQILTPVMSPVEAAHRRFVINVQDNMINNNILLSDMMLLALQ